MKDLKHKVALVTGGGQGLGKAICETLAEAGCIIVPADIKEEQIKALEKELQAKGTQAKAYKLDVSDEQSAKEVIENITKEFGRLDILINNAGVDVTKPVSELSVAEFDRVIKINLHGKFVMAKYALEVMSKQKSGHIVNIASTAAKRAWPNASAYHASKWGILGLSYALYTEARQEKVKVSVVIPGGMRTPFILERFPDTPLDKLQDPKNVAETIKFVLSQPDESIIPEVMVIPLQETSWP
jgi:NAD(P)-dependent dehydrogenase (short-subunit alcohol dehydrogenase family)